jgi:2-keto-4-pentenoate hydratase/2-oxohepta-3-ene-1,7-dioic acid hydratase in catechol pathway
MKLLTYVENGAYKLGLVRDDGVVPLSMSADDFFRRGLDALPELERLSHNSAAPIKEASLTLAPVVPNPGKILCVGLNYRKHAAESGMAVPEFPLLFSKFNNALAASGEAVPVPSGWQKIDYESELVAVIGKTAKNVSEANALNYVLGYCNGNDLSERALQLRTSQWLIGKSLDKFLPIGPYLVTADEVGDPQNMPITGKLNGDLRQNSHTSNMIFSVAQIIAYASQLMTLSPGDIISTGTPDGVILGLPVEQQQWMKAGDTYTVEVGSLGRLTNTLVAG